MNEPQTSLMLKEDARMNPPHIHTRLKPSLAQNKHLIHHLRVRFSSFCIVVFVKQTHVTRGNTGYHILILCHTVLRYPTPHKNLNASISQIQGSAMATRILDLIIDVELLNLENIILAFIKVQVLSRPGSHLGSTDTFANRFLSLQIDFSSKLFLDFLHKLLSHIVSGFFVRAWVQLRNIQCCDRVYDMNAAK